MKYCLCLIAAAACLSPSIVHAWGLNDLVNVAKTAVTESNDEKEEETAATEEEAEPESLLNLDATFSELREIESILARSTMELQLVQADIASALGYERFVEATAKDVAKAKTLLNNSTSDLLAAASLEDPASLGNFVTNVYQSNAELSDYLKQLAPETSATLTAAELSVADFETRIDAALADFESIPMRLQKLSTTFTMELSQTQTKLTSKVAELRGNPFAMLTMRDDLDALRADIERIEMGQQSIERIPEHIESINQIVQNLPGMLTALHTSTVDAESEMSAATGG